MHFLQPNVVSQNQWQIYKHLELIPESVPHPQTSSLNFTFGLTWVWQILLTALADELVHLDQQTEYLERCWAQSKTESELNLRPTRLQQLWALMN